MRNIGIVTVGRSDYGIYLPVLRRMGAEPNCAITLLVAGMHLEQRYGMTVRFIEADGFPIGECIAMNMEDDSPAGIARSLGRGVEGFAAAMSRRQLDLIVVLGDRFEMFAAGLAALLLNIPVAHLHGGELTEGALDDALRHSLTKLSHIHFASTKVYAHRIQQLGEEPWRIHMTGSPALDHLGSLKLQSREELERQLNMKLTPAPLLVTFHPVTLEGGRTREYIEALLDALCDVDMPCVFTMPNADTNNQLVAQKIEEFAAADSRHRLAGNLGTPTYCSLMVFAAAMVGNSSSGLVEAPSFKLPVVNVGTRQAGRLRAANVYDVECTRAAIAAGIREVIQPYFRDRLQNLINPNGDGHAADRIVQVLASIPLDDRLRQKHFIDLAWEA